MRKFTYLHFLLKALASLLAIFVLSFVFNACRKEEKKTIEKADSEIAPKRPGANKYPGPCPYPCDDPECIPYHDYCGGAELDPHAMTTLFSNINHTQLQQLVNGNDSAAIETFFYPLANQIADHILAKYGEDIRDEIGDFPQAMVLLGLFEYGIENNISLDSVESIVNRAIDPYDCFSAALGGILSIPNLVDIYNDFKHGVSPRTILRTLKSFGKRIFTAIAIGWAVVELGDCLDWW